MKTVQEKQRVIFWDEDTQVDFIQPDGALPAPGALEIVPALARLTRFAVEHRIPILASVDSHVENDREFRDFPPHCVRGTPGQAKIPETRTPASEVAEPRRMNVQVQLLLGGELDMLVIEKDNLDVFTVPLAEKLLRALAPARVYVYGVATEHCVRKVVLGLRERQYHATLVVDAVRAIEDAAGVRAIEEMTQAGADLATSAEVLRVLGPT